LFSVFGLIWSGEKLRIGILVTMRSCDLMDPSITRVDGMEFIDSPLEVASTLDQLSCPSITTRSDGSRSWSAAGKQRQVSQASQHEARRSSDKATG
jgi:hypothetical protein